MSREISELARRFATRYGLRVCEPLGSGIHGSVYLVQGNAKGGATALKAHYSAEFYQRETDVYRRLQESNVRQVLGLAVPQMIRADDELLGLEMTVVEKPYLLDFAGAYLDIAPEFSDEIWADWEADRREKFGVQWPRVQEVLAALEEYGIYLLDVNPGNLAFED